MEPDITTVEQILDKIIDDDSMPYFVVSVRFCITAVFGVSMGKVLVILHL